MNGKRTFQTLIRFFLYGFLLLALSNVHGNRASAEGKDEISAPEQKRVTVRVNVDEIQIETVVVDWRGRYLKDLTAKDFEIYQDGQPLEITSCRYISYDQGALPVDEIDAGKTSAVPDASSLILKEEDVRRTLVFLVDNLMMSFENVYYARMALNKFVEEQMQPGDLVAILTTSKGHLGPLAFTSNKEQLLRSIKNIQKDNFQITGVRCDDQYKHMLATVQYFNEALRQMPGRRSLIWVSGLTRMPPPPAPMEFDDDECRDRLIEAFDGLTDEMLNTGVVFHTLDIKGLSVSGSHALEGSEIPLSEKTGGLFLENENFFLDGLGRLKEEINGYYLLSYIPPTGTIASDGSVTPHKIEIKAKRRMSEVRHREQAFVGRTRTGSGDLPEDSLMEAVMSPFQNSELSMQLSSGYLRNSEGNSLLRSWLYLDGEKLEAKEENDGDQYITVEALGMISDTDSRIWDEGRQNFKLPVRKNELPRIRENGIRFSVDIPAKTPGAYYVRMAVKDEGSGKLGSAYQYVEVPDLKKDRLALSDIFITEGKEGSEKTEGVRSALKPYKWDETLGYEVEIYNARVKKRNPPELEYQYVLYRDGKEILTDGPIKIDTEGVSEYGKITLANELKVTDSFEPGMYALRLDVRDRLRKEKDGVATKWLDFEIASPGAAYFIRAAQEKRQNGIEAEGDGNTDTAIAAFTETARLYREALQASPDSLDALTGLEEVEDAIRESLSKLHVIHKVRDVRKDKEYWLKRAEEWRTAVENHEPGLLDEAAVTIAGWPAVDVWITHHLALYAASKKTGWFPDEGYRILRDEFWDKGVSVDDIVDAINLENNPDLMLKRAGLLYTDIILLRLYSGQGGGSIPSQILIVDGRDVSRERKTFYWEMARDMFEAVSEKSRSDEWIRKWFAATSAHLMGQRLFSYADPNLDAALRLFPSAPQLLFYAGVLHEAYAAPDIQNARDMNAGIFTMDSGKAELKNARKYYEKSVEEDPEFFESRLHLGRVNGLLGDHERAIEELKKAADGLTDSRLRYYCALFLGDELAAMDRREEARGQYKLAASLYPKAQSPLLCLSWLDRDTGNFEKAVTAVKKVFILSAGGGIVEDPVHVYDSYAVRNASALIDEMYVTAEEFIR